MSSKKISEISFDKTNEKSFSNFSAGIDGNSCVNVVLLPVRKGERNKPDWRIGSLSWNENKMETSEEGF